VEKRHAGHGGYLTWTSEQNGDRGFGDKFRILRKPRWSSLSGKYRFTFGFKVPPTGEEVDIGKWWVPAEVARPTAD
jgi:hypothetical protein